MKSNREILSELLSDKSIKKILIGEAHIDHTPKDLLLDNMDLFIDKSVIKGRNVKILLEFVNAQIIKKYKDIILELISSDTQEADKAIDLLIDKCIFPPESRCYATADKIMNLIKTALHYGIEIDGVEPTTFSNISINKRIELFNTETSKYINQSSTDDDIVILLAGSTHIVDILNDSEINNIVSKGIKSRVSQEKDTVAWFVKDSENEKEEIRYDEQNILSNGLKQQFDILTVKVSEIEQQRTFQLAGNQLKPSLIVSNASPSPYLNFVK